MSTKARKRKVLIIGVDGGRGDLIAQVVHEGKAPHLASLVFQTPNQGCAKPHSGPKTHPKAMWKTCPGWSSVTSGLDNSKHNVRDNSAESIMHYWAARMRYGNIFDFFRTAGYKTAACGRPNVLTYGDAAGILDTSPIHWRQARPVSDQKGDAKNTTWAIDKMKKADLLFVHLDAMDQAGHQYKWGSRQYMQAIALTDVQIGRLLQAVEKRSRREDWLVMITADHGGHGYNHNRVQGKDNCIPFYCNKRLTHPSDISHMDVTPTAMKWMHIRKSKHMDGSNRLPRK